MVFYNVLIDLMDCQIYAFGGKSKMFCHHVTSTLAARWYINWYDY